MDTNFSFRDLVEFWNVVNINFLSIVFAAIIGAVVSFFIVIVLQIVLRKKILVRRRYSVLKYLAYLYMVFFPVFTALCFSAWSALHNSEKQLIANIPTYLGESNEAFNRRFKAEIQEMVEAKYLELTGKQVYDKTFLVAGEMAQHVGITECRIEMVMLKYLLESSLVQDAIMSKITSGLSSVLLVNEETIEDLMNTQFQNLLDDGILNSVCEKYTRNILGGFKMNILLLFLLGISIPLLEIILANRWENKRQEELRLNKN